MQHIVLLSKSVSTLSWDSATLSCSTSFAFYIVNFLRLVASDVMALARLLRASDMCDSSTWG